VISFGLLVANAMVRAACLSVLAALSGCDAAGHRKYQVLIPKPQQHASGESVLQFGPAELAALEQAARASDEETFRIMEAQLLDRLSRRGENGSGSQLSVEFLHKLPAWRGADSWQPSRERNETYGLYVSDEKLVVDAQSPWALANAMSTLYQLMEVKGAERETIAIPGCPHEIVDSPAFPHRGLLVDTSRTFYSVQWLKDLIVQLGQFKLNVLHLHLTDTAAWSFAVEAHPELAEYLSYRDIDDKAQTYSRKEIQELVEFARLRGVSLEPEVDGPVHAPTMASAEPLKLTVATGVDLTTDDYGAEPPVGTWNFSSPRVTDLLTDVFQQLEQDFVTAPFLHVGGDEPKAAAVCAALTDEATKAECVKQCTGAGGGSPYAAHCRAVPEKPQDASETYWFPEVLNSHIQGYFDAVVPEAAKTPVAAWSGVREDMGVHLPGKGKPALQLWEFPQPGAKDGGLTEEDCERYDLIQSSATHPLKDGSGGYTDQGWLYLECGEGQNWISMSKDYWCSRAPWVAMYSLNLTRHHAPALQTEKCQKAFLGGEIAIWGEITGGNSMSLIFPRAVAFAERTWTNPPALSWEELSASKGSPPGQYWQDHLKGALHRLNTVVENFALQGVQSARLQPKFCFDHPEYCDHYSEPFLPIDAAAVV
jgi:hexosaminidase